MSFFKFIFSKVFFLNLLIALLITAGLLYVVVSYLDNFTHHGEQILVPNVLGKKTEELDTALVEKGFEYVIIDSIFDRKRPKGVVVDQSPSPDYFVKEGRKLYLTINARTTKKITIKEDMTDLSMKDAMDRLQSYGVKVDIMMKNSTPAGVVLNVLYQGVKVIPGKTLINDGDVVKIVVSSGGNSTAFLSPYIGMSLKDAMAQVQGSALLPVPRALGKVMCKTEADSMSAIVVRQTPEYEQGLKMKVGAPVMLFFSCDTAYHEPAPTTP
ncbi:MAG: PASTA domain-containing protein [Bacteroidetes bacterium]|nr:PASTA domain-containing protein [Bacteroidota bacterium]